MMTNIDSQAEIWQTNTDQELRQLKQETVERIINKMKEDKQNDIFLHLWKDLVTDYLLYDEESSDKIHDFFLWISINLFSASAKQLKDIREKIRNSHTKEELDNLEKSITEEFNKWWNRQETIASTSTAAGSWLNGATSNEVESTWTTTKVWNNPWETLESAKVWRAANVPKNERMKRLFPQWTPKTEKEMKQYLTTIKVPIYTAEWKTKKMKLTIHKRLSEEFEKVFEEMYNKRIPVNPEKTWWFNWRKMRRWSKMSHHSYWSAVDVNYDVNGWVYGKTDKNSPYFNDNETVAIWKKHGFYRWWDRSSKSNDPMHFTYMNA